MTTTLFATQPETLPTAFNEAVVASYRNHSDAEKAVRLLVAGGLPVAAISLIGRNFETQEDVVGFYRPIDGALDGAGEGAWFGGLFGLMLGAMGFFVMPIIGGIMVMGPLAGMIAGAIGGAGVGALINGLVTAGVPRDQALLYQERLKTGEFLIVVHGVGVDGRRRAHEILEGTARTHLQEHGTAMADSRGSSMGGMKM